MLAKNEVAKVYDTILSIPGMNDEVKVNLKVSRKNLLLITKAIERCIHGKDGDDKSSLILDAVPKETLLMLKEVTNELLEKAGLTELNEKLQSL